MPRRAAKALRWKTPPIEAHSSVAARAGRSFRRSDTARHEVGHRVTNAVIKLRGELPALLSLSRPQIQKVVLGPISHNAVAAEERHVVGIRQLAYRDQIGSELDHRVGLAGELHVHQHHLGLCGAQFINPGLHRLPELVDVGPSNRLHRTSLPDYKRWFQGEDVTAKALDRRLRL